jgi:alkylated DNA repair dioxygenase AlkB
MPSKDSEAMSIDFLKLLREEKRRVQRQGLSNEKKENSFDLQKKDNNWKQNPPPPDWNFGHNFNSSQCPIFDRIRHRVSRQLSTIYYIPNFLNTTTTNHHLVHWLKLLPENVMNQEMSAEGHWTTMRYGKRKVAIFRENPFPPPLQQLVDILVDKEIFPSSKAPNHILINHYEAGQGILPHTDGPAYWPQTATLSLGPSSVLLKFSPRLSTHEIGQKTVETREELLLEGDGSLVIFADEAYTQYTHGIDNVVHEVASDKCVNADYGTMIQRDWRISITFRHALANVTTNTNFYESAF